MARIERSFTRWLPQRSVVQADHHARARRACGISIVADVAAKKDFTLIGPSKELGQVRVDPEVVPTFAAMKVMVFQRPKASALHPCSPRGPHVARSGVSSLGRRSQDDRRPRRLGVDPVLIPCDHCSWRRCDGWADPARWRTRFFEAEAFGRWTNHDPHRRECRHDQAAHLRPGSFDQLLQRPDPSSRLPSATCQSACSPAQASSACSRRSLRDNLGCHRGKIVRRAIPVNRSQCSPRSRTGPPT